MLSSLSQISVEVSLTIIQLLEIFVICLSPLMVMTSLSGSLDPEPYPLLLLPDLMLQLPVKVADEGEFTVRVPPVPKVKVYPLKSDVSSFPLSVK